MVRILLADVDPDTRRILGDYLGANGFLVDTCETPTELLAALSSDPPAAVIVEIHDFGHDSLELVRKVREGAAGRPVPVLVFTSSPRRSLLAEAEALGASVVTKPAPPGRVLLVLRALLLGGPPDPPERGSTGRESRSTRDARPRKP